MKRSLLLLVVVAGVLAPSPAGAAPAATPATSGTATLQASAAHLDYGGSLDLSGALSTDPACLEERDVRFASRAPGDALWTEIAQGATGPAGGFSVSDLRPGTTADYRAEVQAETRGTIVCDPVLSPELTVGVRARVGATPSRNPAVAGGCVDLLVEVAPGKPGQDVLVERRRDGSWVTEATAVLDGSSAAAPTLCFGWADLGRVRLRARWEAQDALNEPSASPARTVRVRKAGWMRDIDDLVPGRGMGVSVRDADAYLYRRSDTHRRTPASNEKLLMSMALLDRMGPDVRIPTIAAVAGGVTEGVVDGTLWILGRGDPTGGKDRLRDLAGAIADAGVTEIRGRVKGSTAYFRHDWWADGWRSYFPALYVAMPTALVYERNADGRRNVTDPERRSARYLVARLEARGIEVHGRPGAGDPPSGLVHVAEARSPRLAGLLERTLVPSSNFFAEVLGKRLSVEAFGPPGTIAGGAAAIRSFAGGHGVRMRARDSSGLSYANRVAPAGIARLLGWAEARPWGQELRTALPAPGRGTLADRLEGVPVRAKTGTLTAISALSGYVWLRKTDSWAEFSILSRGLSKERAVEIEDRVVRILWRRAH